MPHDPRAEEEQKTQKRAAILGMGYTDTSGLQKQLFKGILSIAELKQYKAVPLMANENYIHFGVTTTTSQQTLSKLRTAFTDQRVDFSIISDSGYAEYIRLYDPPPKVEYQDISIKGGQEENQDIVSAVSSSLEQVRPDDMLAFLVQQAYKLKASDIHLENQKENIRVRYRIDGVLHPVAFMGREKYRHLSSVIASAANIYSESEDAQTGHISREYRLSNGEEVVVNLRVESVPTVYGMDVVMRLFNLRMEMFKLDSLGLSTSEAKVVDDIIKNPSGLVLVVGPTGSGKTTTLYSLINTLNSTERKIITLEDPVEYNIAGVVQIPVHGELKADSFAEKLRSVLRLDPDIVMVGETRDSDTARTALQGALTGHLVLSTFHASSASAALTRLLDMIGSNPLLPSAIRLIMAQRLARRLDDATKKPYKTDESMMRRLHQIVDSFPPGLQKPDLGNITFYEPGSSPENPFGYSGQIVLREQLLMSQNLQNLMRLPATELTTERIEKEAVAGGMATMLQDGIMKAASGQTSLQEVFRVLG